MTLYNLILVLHILAIVAWLGGGAASTAYLRAASKLDSTAAIQPILVRSNALGDRMFAPSGFLALLTGVYLVWDGPWSFGDLWVILGIAGLVVAIAIGAGFHSRMGKQTLAACERGDLAETTALLRRWVAGSRIDMIILVLVVADMVFKPTL